jgi:predicted dehydrogenase
MTPVRAGIVGLGRWGKSLVRSVQGKSDEIAFVAATTRTRASAEAFCAEQNMPLRESYADLLADPNIDAVVLATPHSQHEAQVKAAAAAGKHIFVEKPITLDRRSADAVVAAAQNAGLVIAVGFCRRFHPSLEDVRRRLRDGKLGTLISMVGQQTSGTSRFMPADGWRVDPHESPAGAMTAVGVHLLDHMIELAGAVRDVHCVSASRRGGPEEDSTTVLLNFDNGATGIIFCSTATTAHFNFAVYGTEGLAEITRTNLQTFRFVPAPDRAPEGHVSAPPAEVAEHPGFDMLNAELVAFARSIRDGVPYPVPIDEVLHGVSVFDAIVESAKTGRIVRVSAR